MSPLRIAAIVAWLGLAWYTRLDRVFIIISLILGIFMNLGIREPGSFSAYNIFNRGFRHLLGDLRADQIDAELRNKFHPGQQRHDSEDDEPEPPAALDRQYSSKEANKLCACGSKKKTKKCCGALSAAEKEERSRFRKAQLEHQARLEKYQFL